MQLNIPWEITNYRRTQVWWSGHVLLCYGKALLHINNWSSDWLQFQDLPSFWMWSPSYLIVLLKAYVMNSETDNIARHSCQLTITSWLVNPLLTVILFHRVVLSSVVPVIELFYMIAHMYRCTRHIIYYARSQEREEDCTSDTPTGRRVVQINLATPASCWISRTVVMFLKIVQISITSVAYY